MHLLWTRGSWPRSAPLSSNQSFSLAAEQLGVTQPAVSLQIRSLEKRLGRQLLDRSGRRVEPTEAGLRLYRSAQRMLALEEQLVEEVADAERGRARRDTPSSAPPPARAARSCRCCSASSSARIRASGISLTVSDTQTIVDQVAGRELALGIVGAARRHRGDDVRAALPRRGRARLPARPRRSRAGRSRSTSSSAEPPIVMQEGAGVRQVIEDALRRPASRLRDLDVKLELGLQESVKSAVTAGYGVTFISRSAIEAELSTGDDRDRRASRASSPRARSRSPLRPAARSRGRPRRSSTSRGGACRDRRLGLDQLRPLLEELGIERPLLVGSERWDGLELPAAARWKDVPSERIAVPEGVDCILAIGGGSAIDTAKAASAETGLPVVSIPTTYSGSEWTPYFGVRRPDRRAVGGGSGARLEGIVYDPELTLSPAAGRDGRHRSQRSRTRSRGALRQGAQPGGGPFCARGRDPDRRRASRRPRGRGRARPPEDVLRAASCAGRRSLLPASGSATPWRRRSAAATAFSHGVMNAIALPLALRFNQPRGREGDRSFGDAMGTDDPVGKVEQPRQARRHRSPPRLRRLRGRARRRRRNGVQRRARGEPETGERRRGRGAPSFRVVRIKRRSRRGPRPRGRRRPRPSRTPRVPLPGSGAKCEG